MIEKRQLGRNGPGVGCLGYGAMVLEGYYGTSDDEQAIRTIHRALEVGLNMIDSADAYGNGHNETLVGRAIAGRRSEAFVATKFGIVFDENERGTDLPTNWGFSLKINGRLAYVRKALTASLKRLGVDAIDLWYAHYADPATPIEETVGAMAEAVQTGKVRYLGLSNVTAEQIRRAHKVHPIAAVQYEYSLWRREAETDLLPTLRELGIALVGWSPLGSGFLTGTVKASIRATFDRITRVTRARIWHRIEIASRLSWPWRKSWASRPRSSHWRGSCIRVRTSSPFRGPGAQSGLMKTQKRQAFGSTRKHCNESMNSPGLG